MEQRRLRPGDSLDDYCPRERRLTDHVVVAVVDDVVKQTRCSACDTEHVYKEGRVPPRRTKQDTSAALYQRVLDAVTDDEGADDSPLPGPLPNLVVRPERKPGKGKRGSGAAVAPEPAPMPPAPPVEVGPPPTEPLLAQPEDDRGEEGPVHRRLIRATLPRPEGQAPTRPLPEFTMRQPGARGGQAGRGGGQWFGAKGGNNLGGPWSGKQNGQGRQRQGPPAHGGQGDSRGRHKGHRSRGSRSHHKKTR